MKKENTKSLASANTKSKAILNNKPIAKEVSNLSQLSNLDNRNTSNKATKTQTGRYYEDLTAKYLIKKGWKILCKNKIINHQEVDLLCYLPKAKILMILEVKYRSNTNYQKDIFNAKKKANLIKCANYLKWKFERIKTNNPQAQNSSNSNASNISNANTKTKFRLNKITIKWCVYTKNNVRFVSVLEV